MKTAKKLSRTFRRKMSYLAAAAISTCLYTATAIAEGEAPAAPTVDSRDAMLAQMKATMDEALADNTRMGDIFDADDKLAAAMAANAELAAENKRLKAEVFGLRERVNGLMGEKNAAIRMSKLWEKKAKAAGVPA